MRRFSRKRKELMESVRQWRDDLRARVGRCEFCLKPCSPELLDVDEISRGSCRAISLTAEYAVLVVHRHCHDYIQTWSRARRLALLYLARSTDYDLEKFWRLTRRNWPDQSDIDLEIEQLLRSR